MFCFHLKNKIYSSSLHVVLVAKMERLLDISTCMWKAWVSPYWFMPKRRGLHTILVITYIVEFDTFWAQKSWLVIWILLDHRYTHLKIIKSLLHSEVIKSYGIHYLVKVKSEREIERKILASYRWWLRKWPPISFSYRYCYKLYQFKVHWAESL